MKRPSFLQRIRNTAFNIAQPLELRFVTQYGANVFYGTVGDKTPYRDSKGADIHVGDVVTFTWRERGYRAIVVKPKGEEVCAFGFAHEPAEIFNLEDIKIVLPFFDQKENYIYNVIHVKAVNETAEQPNPAEPYSLVALTGLLSNADDKLIPVEPRSELLCVLFGIHSPYTVDTLDHEQFKRRVRVWEISKDYHIYTFSESIIEAVKSPLAIVRLNTDLPHGPNSYVDRIIGGYWFDKATNQRFTDWIKTIHTPEKLYPLGNEINQTAIELAITMIDDHS